MGELTKVPDAMLEINYSEGIGSGLRVGAMFNPGGQSTTSGDAYVAASGTTLCYGMCEKVDDSPRFKITNPPKGVYIVTLISSLGTVVIGAYPISYMLVCEDTTGLNSNWTFGKNQHSGSSSQHRTSCIRTMVLPIYTTLTQLDFRMRFATSHSTAACTIVTGINMILEYHPFVEGMDN